MFSPVYLNISYTYITKSNMAITRHTRSTIIRLPDKDGSSSESEAPFRVVISDSEDAVDDGTTQQVHV